MANGFDFGRMNSSANAYQSPNRRYSQMLLQSLPQRPRRGNIGQAADLLQSGLGAYLGVKDIGQQQAAQQAFASGAKGGDLKAAMGALENLSGNPYAQNRLQNLLMQQVSQSQKEEQRLKELESERETYKFQQEHKAFAPTRLVPGKDVPFPSAVQSQFVERAQAAKPSWGQLPGVPGMMVSSTGQMQAVPQTAEQKAQATLAAEAAKSQAEARRGFPKVEQTAQEALANIEALTQHSGMKGVIGAPDTLSGLVFKLFGTALPGTAEAGFTARLDQIGGQQFLQAFESLKGGGAISEIEGTKASNAMSRLAKTGQSEESYLQAANELKTIIEKGLANSRTAAGLQPPLGQPPLGQQLPSGVAAMLPSGVGGQPAVALPPPPPSIAGQELSMPPSTGYQPPPPQVALAMEQPPRGIAEQPMAMPLGLQIPPGVREQAGGLDLMSMYNPPPAVGPPGAVPQGQQLSSSGRVQISSDAEFDSLPSGTEFIGPDGQQRRKP
ncbi:MAG: hypothetical protein V3U88_08645 [Methylococcales bacterium]